MKNLNIKRNVIFPAIVMVLLAIAFLLGTYINNQRYISKKGAEVNALLSKTDSYYREENHIDAITELDKALMLVLDLETRYLFRDTKPLIQLESDVLRYKAQILADCTYCPDNVENALNTINESIETLESTTYTEDTLNNLLAIKAEILLRGNNLSEAKKLANTLLETSEKTQAYKLLAWAYFEEEDINNAKQYIGKAKELDPEDIKIEMLRKDIYKEPKVEQTKIIDTYNPLTQENSMSYEDVSNTLLEIGNSIDQGMYWFNHSLNFYTPFFCSSEKPNKSNFDTGKTYFTNALTKIESVENKNIKEEQKELLSKLKNITQKASALVERDYHNCNEYYENGDLEALEQDIEYHNQEVKEIERMTNSL